jgi:transposase
MTAAIGTIERFDNPEKLVSYLGLNPSVRQSGEPYRVFRRLQLLRGWSHDKTSSPIFS